MAKMWVCYGVCKSLIAVSSYIIYPTLHAIKIWSPQVVQLWKVEIWGCYTVSKSLAALSSYIIYATEIWSQHKSFSCKRSRCGDIMLSPSPCQLSLPTLSALHCQLLTNTTLFIPFVQLETRPWCSYTLMTKLTPALATFVNLLMSLFNYPSRNWYDLCRRS